MARRNKRASMREGPLSDLFKSTAEDAPADPPEAPRYGRLDPAEAKKAEDEGDRPAGPVADEDTSSSQAVGEAPSSAPPAGGTPASEGSQALFDQAADEPVAEQPVAETPPERLKRVFSEEPKPRYERPEEPAN